MTGIDPDTRRPTAPHADVARVLVPRDDIARRVDELAAEIAEAYAGRELTILAVMTGSLVFVSELIRRLPLRVRVEVAKVSSYPGTAVSTRGPRLLLPPAGELSGRHVLIVDDILDSGLTLESLAERVAGAGAEEVRACVLLRKARADLPRRVEADFVGFDVPDEFVVGYGLDYDNLYRNLPDLCVLKGVAGRPEEAL
jgi:hypoxanthine phosphoribosyltransferase